MEETKVSNSSNNIKSLQNCHLEPVQRYLTCIFLKYDANYLIEYLQSRSAEKKNER